MTQQPPSGPTAPLPWISVALALILTACSSGTGDTGAGNAPPPPTVSPPAATLTVRGEVSLGVGDFAWDDGAGQGLTGPTCAGDGGYDDMRTGAAVTVVDAAGTVVGVGQVGSSIPTDFSEAQTPTRCKLSFSVAGVPAGRGFYGVEVAGRGSVKFEEAALSSPVELTLGS